METALKNDQHVVPNPKGGWSVLRSGASRATRVFDNKEEAVGFAKKRAKKDSAELYVHRRDGTIQERDSYGRNQFPPIDKR
jgi:Uncharacterized protein conserved in bacteria (DUF2188)